MTTRLDRAAGCIVSGWPTAFIAAFWVAVIGYCVVGPIQWVLWS